MTQQGLSAGYSSSKCLLACQVSKHRQAAKRKHTYVCARLYNHAKPQNHNHAPGAHQSIHAGLCALPSPPLAPAPPAPSTPQQRTQRQAANQRGPKYGMQVGLIVIRGERYHLLVHVADFWTSACTQQACERQNQQGNFNNSTLCSGRWPQVYPGQAYPRTGSRLCA